MSELVPDEVNASASPHTGLSACLESIITWWALAGGGVFCALVIMSIVSIVGRKLVSMPIEGDMEILQMGSAIGGATFLPLCELQDQHIKVDALTTWVSKRACAVLDALAHGLLLVASVFLAWRTTLYVFEAHENHELSTILLVPLWLPVMLLVPSLVLLVLAASYQVKKAVVIVWGEKK